MIPLLVLPFAAGVVCCWLALRPANRAGILPAVPVGQVGLEGQLQGIDLSQVEALAIDRRGDVIEIGLLLSELEIRRSEDGVSQFEGQLHNIGDFPIENARVELRLRDGQDQFVDTIVLRGDRLVIAPRQWMQLSGEYRVRGRPARIVEEGLFLTSNETIAFTLYSYADPRESPGGLADLARVLPFLGYQALWTNPRMDWASYEIQFAIDRVITG